MRTTYSKLFLSIAAAAGLSVAAAMPALAQPEAPNPPEPEHERPQPQMPQQQQADIDVSDKEVQKFADVYNETAEVRQKYTQQLQNAEDQQEAQNIQREANEEIKSVIEESPLTVERYQEIARATAQDTELRQRILEATNQ
jgi:hypothetical protein